MKITLNLFYLFLFPVLTFAQNIPLPEHPRPDFERSEWINLNGKWAFEFDNADVGLSQNWQNGGQVFTKEINVPFPWGAPLSGVADKADFAWYAKEINIPTSWGGKRPFLTIGASDYETTVWLDGHLLGTHKGGYTPFSFDLTPFATPGKVQKIIVRVDDVRRDYALYGKQGYGNARGIWQTVYLEARGKQYIESAHFTPDIDHNSVKVDLTFDSPLLKDELVQLNIETPKGLIAESFMAKKGEQFATRVVNIPDARWWTLEDPYLYNISVATSDDAVKSYFGMRKISVTDLPGTDIPYVALNNKPVYMQLTLDQSYHPDGFYTFPSDEFMRNEIQLCKDIGLNGLRTHIKVDIPRKLYWADKLGLLVMADLPNFWGEPNAQAQQESAYTLREMIKRDYNHPAIFSWIVFNETWGLKTKVTDQKTGETENKYLPKTQNWVASMYYLAKSLDQSRLAEDNSICCGAGHTQTDLNSWHEYLPGYAWEEHMQKIDAGTYPGSTFHFEKGFTQGHQPMFNSECGNVWGYEGSTGDVDWSYDYHRMMNTFRMHPKMSGWLYTEHHDVINEWNGYWRFDRSPKFTGVGDLAPGMTDADFHSLIYLSNGQDITHTVNHAEVVNVPMFISVMKELGGIKEFEISYALNGMNKIGNEVKGISGNLKVPAEAYMQKKLEDLSIQMPEESGLYVLSLQLKDAATGRLLHTNFVNFEVKNGLGRANVQVIEQLPSDYKVGNWSQKTWSVMDGLKVNGAGSGKFTYVFSGKVKKPKSGYLLMELGAKELFVKDQEGTDIKDEDYMLGAIAAPSQNKNSYPMTDTKLHSSDVEIYINGALAQKVHLDDDPADHRGILSWHHQAQNRKLDEAGSYGYMVKVPLTDAQLKAFEAQGSANVELRVTNGGGLAVYGAEFGRYPFNPSLVFLK